MRFAKKNTPLLGVLVLAALTVVPQDARSAGATRVKLGTMAPEGSPWITTLENMSRQLQASTGGQFKWQIFPGGQLGDEIQMAESAQYGSIECAGVSTGALANLLPSMQVFELPFFWESREEAYYVIDNYFRDYFAKELAKVDLVLLGWSENGWRHFYAKGNTPIRAPGDLKGRKMRSQESDVHIKFWQALNVSPIPLPTTEIYTALERGIIDGGDNTLVLIMAAGWAEVINTVTLSGHMYQPAVLVCNKGWWDTVSPEHKQVFYGSMRKTEGEMRAALLDAEKELVDVFKEMGRQVVELTPAERDAFRKMTQKLAQDSGLRSQIGEDVLRLAEQGKAAYAAQKQK